jgi:putative sugar O-methyltransferase
MTRPHHLDEMFERAFTLHHAGQLQDAEPLYRQMLASFAEDPDALTALAALLAETGREPEAGRLLDTAVAIHPNHVRAHAQRDRVRFLAKRAADPATARELQEMRATLDRMNGELRRRKIYEPSAFWEKYGSLHVYLLERYGIQNFKRTVAHNYQNWLMLNPLDRQVQRLAELWVTHLSSRPLRNAAELPDDVGFHEPRTTPFYPLAQPENLEIYKLSVGLLWEYTLASDDRGILAGLSESLLGNPLRIYRDGKLIASDLCHSVRERNELLQHSGLRGDEGLVVGELGAGNGRLAELFGQTTNYRYMIFDITPALYVSQWYVKNLFPGEKVFEFRPFEDYAEIREELAGARFAFFTANQIELLPPGTVDIFININSLTEMAQAQIANFLQQIDRVTKSWLYLQQWYYWVNPIEYVEITKETFHPGKRWEPAYEGPNDVYPDFFVQLWKRPGQR